jgi:hypothetical protein
MLRRVELGVSLTFLAAMIASRIFIPAAGQEISRDLNARARVFPGVGPGLVAVKRDSAGRYFILAAPAKSIAIYSADGKPAGQIPRANSSGAAIVFA